MFLSIMLWFVLDNAKSPTVILDGDRVYPIYDVVKHNPPSINFECNLDEYENLIEDEQTTRRSSSVSKLMIDQFFTDIEGPNRDWQIYDLNLYDN